MRLLLVLSALAVCMVAAVAGDYTPAAQADKITSLPGLSVQASFNQFSGYLTFGAKHIFYWYVESTNKPATDPLVWWSNGGPGCSGLLGHMTEHGPFRVKPHGDGLEPFDFAWNTMVNTLYIEAPVGVGFSYSDNPADYSTGDAQTAADNLAAIQQFLIRFPHLKTNDFYIASESYGGHYVPTLTQSILASGDASLLAQFKGFLVGNPLTDMDENANWGQAGTMCGHSLASRPTCDSFTQHCLGSSGPDAQCGAAQSAVVSEAGGLDLYGLDFPTCSSNTAEQKRLLLSIYARQMHQKGFNPTLKAELLDHSPKHALRNNVQSGIPVFDPCTMDELTTYLGRADVRAALHVSPNSFTWAACSGHISYSNDDVNAPMEPIYTQLLASSHPMKMVIFSGDDDSICASLGTQHWIYNMLYNKVVQPWTQWNYDSEDYGSQIGGSIVKFQGISLVTVHGAGHMVSEYKPEKGLAVLKNFLAGKFTVDAPHKHKHQHREIAAQ